MKIQSIFANLDSLVEGQLSYSEFIIGALEPELHLNKANIYSLFKYLDVFGQDFLTTDGIKMVLARKGKLTTTQYIQKMFYEVENIIGDSNSQSTSEFNFQEKIITFKQLCMIVGCRKGEKKGNAV